MQALHHPEICAGCWSDSLSVWRDELLGDPGTGEKRLEGGELGMLQMIWQRHKGQSQNSVGVGLPW